MTISNEILIKFAWSIAVVIGAEIVRNVLRGVIKTITERLHNQRARTVGGLLHNAVKFIVWSIAFTWLLSIAGIDIRPLLAGAGVLGLAIGFGAQSLVKDIISGLLLLVDNHVGVGDKVEISGITGKVVSMKLRYLVIEDAKGSTHIIPNSQINIVSKLKEA